MAQRKRVTLGTKTLLLTALLAATSATAQDRQAVIIANRNYDRLSDVSDASLALGLASRLTRAGFTVSEHRDTDTEDLRTAAAAITQALAEGDEVLVFLSGQTVTIGTQAWFLATDATRPSALLPGDKALSIGAVLNAMSADKGSAVLLVGEARNGTSATGVSAGLGSLEVPQGVSVFAGPTETLVKLTTDSLLTEGLALGTIAAEAPRSLRAQGYLPQSRAFLKGQSSGGGLPNGVSARDLEDFLYARAAAAGTSEALTDFLNRYPTGTNATAARRLLADLSRSPAQVAQDAENALGLTRAQKMEVQQNLTLMGYDTNGVDGLFGRGSRTAISRWQSANGYAATGYVTAPQINVLAAQATAQRQATERDDAAYWRQTGGLGTEKGYRDYLARYPKGLFSDLALTELAALERAQQSEASAAELKLWTEITKIDNAAAYRAFLNRYPDGVFSAEAKARIAALEQPTAPAAVTQSQIDAAKAKEDQALANPFLRLLAEQRLTAFGYNPGQIDGTFDTATRTAIKGLQTEYDIPATGYLDSQTITILLNTAD